MAPSSEGLSSASCPSFDLLWDFHFALGIVDVRNAILTLGRQTVVIPICEVGAPRSEDQVRFDKKENSV
jgi:hypothetical protein